MSPDRPCKILSLMPVEVTVPRQSVAKTSHSEETEEGGLDNAGRGQNNGTKREINLLGLALRGLLGVGLVAVGLYIYPTGILKKDDGVVPQSLILTGGAVIIVIVLDLIYHKVCRSGMAMIGATSRPPTEGYRLTVSALTGALATVLALVAVFNATPEDPIRIGALALVVGVFLGFITLYFLAFDPPTKAADEFIRLLMQILFAIAGFGLACIGLAVFNS
jgi:hypothetical protein